MLLTISKIKDDIQVVSQQSCFIATYESSRVAGYGEYIYECLIFYIDNSTRHFKELQGYQQSMKLHDDCAESILSIYLSVISLRNI